MTGDLSVKFAEGMLNVRVGALLVRGNSVLMVNGSHGDYYTVGGRVRFGETMQSALMREISEASSRRRAMRFTGKFFPN